MVGPSRRIHSWQAGLVSLAYPTGHSLRLRLRSLKRQKIVLHHLIDTRGRMNPLSIPQNAQQLMVSWQLPELTQLRWPPQVHP